MNFKEKLNHVKAFVFDVDGVLGSDRVVLHHEGELMRTMNIKDGFAMQYAIRKGYTIAIISGGRSESVRQRFVNLGVQHICMQSKDKVADYQKFLQQYNLTDEQILYMGDDLPDYDVMCQVAVPTCPCTAADEVKEIAVYISPYPGGEGAVRDIIQQTMRVQGTWVDKVAWRW